MIIKRGFSRTVLLIGKYAIKFPSCYSHKSFLYGCYCNLSERIFYKSFGKYGINIEKDYCCPTLYCSIFGLFQIQLKASLLDRELTYKEKEIFKGITTDFIKENFGYLNSKLVCIDYA